MKIQTFFIKDLSPQEVEQLLSSLHTLAVRNLKTVTLEYLKKRMKNYDIITLVYGKTSNELLGFSFSHIYFLPFLVFQIPVFHIGLTLVSQSFRKRHISAVLFLSVYDFLIKKNIVKKTVYLTGALLTAKCSTPVSFLKIKKSSSHTNWPRIRSPHKLSRLSYFWMSKAFSRHLSRLLSGTETDDFILRDVNKESGFQLAQEEYLFHSKKDRVIVQFFKNNIMPNNELITAVWFHPLVVFFKRQTLSRLVDL